ncbi:MAG: AmmeMemoRadiSam system protein B [Candidatus Eremiobacteraeota bacterium]|nr:AmmeMemoRadiSam system protein B [Candidatus Eremiobacteraeota bacterium]
MKIRIYIIIVIGLIISGWLLIQGCNAHKRKRSGKKVAEKKLEFVRMPVFNGQFYEGNPDKLRKLINKFFDNVPEIEIPGKLIGLIEPHAGYPFSGQVAAYGYKQLIGKKYKTAIVMAPSHRHRFEGVSIIKEGKYRTPLGDVPIDKEAADKISSHNPKLIRFVPQAHTSEHSLEVQVPLLQVALGDDWKIVPIVFGAVDPGTCKIVAEAIAKQYDPDTQILIASSDMYHGYSYEDCMSMDKKTLDKIDKMNLTGLVEAFRTRESECCGSGPIMVVMMLTTSMGGDAKILKYTNSADITGSRGEWTVGYGCVAFYVEEGAKVTRKVEEPKKKEEDIEEKVEFTVTGEQKKMLISMARKTLEEKLINGKDVEFDQKSDLLDKKLGLFVTLRKGPHLRGCIGHCFPYKKLRIALPELALAAALGDSRFPTMKKGELKDINIEISLLSPMRQISDYNKIKIPGHGVYVKKGFRSGVFLPQVAVETGWNRETFMAHLCSDKAGLPSDAWKKPGIELYVFTVIKFEEE